MADLCSLVFTVDAAGSRDIGLTLALLLLALDVEPEWGLPASVDLDLGRSSFSVVEANGDFEEARLCFLD